MKHWHKVSLIFLCVAALFFFDSREKAHAGNNSVAVGSDTIRVHVGRISVRSHCVLLVKKRRKPVKCPVCKSWVRTLETRAREGNATYRRYECANEHRFVTHEKVERVLQVRTPKRKAA